MKQKKRVLPDLTAQPHDGLVRYAFSRRIHARGLLKAILPAALVSSITWSTLKLEKDSFIDPDLRKRFADLLFSMRVRGVEVRVYVLLEHQRGVEVLMMLRVLGYITRIWERLVRDDPSRRTIPAIVPVLLHNGRYGWTAETSFDKIVDLPERARDVLLPHTPCFGARLVDLGPEHATALEDAWLTAFGKLVLWALSVAGDNPRFLAEIDRMQGAIAEALAAPDGYEALAALLRYISTTHERIGAHRFENALTAAAGKNEAKTIMTILEEIEQRGERKGRAKTLVDQLVARFGSVPATTRRRILAADEPTLARWSIRVLSETSIDAVIDGATPKKAGTASKHVRASGA